MSNGCNDNRIKKLVMDKIDRNTPIWQITLGDFLNALESHHTQQANQNTEPSQDAEKKEYVYGISGLANLIGCSKSHASRLKSQGIFKDAIKQNGRKIIVDKERAIELFNKKE